MIPLDPIGYAVNPATGTIHTRYATHAGDSYRTRTEKGVLALLDGKEGTACETCYPNPRYAATTPRNPQRRRKPKTARKAKVSA